MKSKLFILITGILLLSLISTSMAYTVVSTTYTKDFVVDATNYAYSSCNVQDNYESGRCQYIYACYIITPYPSTSLNQAVQKECVDITDTKKTTLHVSYTPYKGQGQLAVTTFLTVLDYTYDTSTTTWKSVLFIPSDYRSAAQIVSLCGEGEMLKENLCYEAKAYCANTQSTNLCTNPYPLYLLNFGTGFDPSNTASYCADRENDKICDEVESVTCADICRKYDSMGLCTESGANGICDVDEQMLAGTTCVDANNNYVCDDVETEGTFCRTNFEPVYCGTGADCVTYPNDCFAQAAGCNNFNQGTCQPIYADYCATDANCPSPCNGVVGQCLNKLNTGFTCYYSGECNAQMIQCAKDSDCPSPYCKGVASVCSSNKCSYSGKCITQPTAPASFWDRLAAIWNQFLAWLNNIFSGGSSNPPITTSSVCYQESANVATSCGGLSTGSYSSEGQFHSSYLAINGYDGNWDTYAIGGASEEGILYFNYAVPTNALKSSLFMAKFGRGDAANYTIPQECFGSQLKFKVVIHNNGPPYGTTGYCYDGSLWKSLYSSTDTEFGDEAMVWDF